MRILAFLLLSWTMKAQQDSLVQYFKEGRTEGHLRNYFMLTDNHNLKDYHANATGGKISYTTKGFKGFEARVSGGFTYRPFGSDLSAADRVTGKPSKWERELFDLANTERFNSLARIEELYVRYRYRNSCITIGKMFPEYHPLINKSDGRMQGFAIQGINSRITVDSTAFISVAVINAVAPRSFMQWYRLSDAIGLVNSGYQPDGTAAAYKRRTGADAIVYIGMLKQLGRLTVTIWDTHLQGIANTFWAEVSYKVKKFVTGFQYSYQFSCHGQQGLPYAARYAQPGENGQVASIMAGYKASGFEASLAYTKAFSSGRFLFPKELGRDQFYTSVPRSRIEGFGDADVVKVSLEYTFENDRLVLGLDATAVDGPGTANYKYNKYGLDDYWQVNSRLYYRFTGLFRGLEIAVLYVWRVNKNIHTPADVYNISDFSQLNVVTNFNF